MAVGGQKKVTKGGKKGGKKKTYDIKLLSFIYTGPTHSPKRNGMTLRLQLCFPRELVHEHW